jgi:hypothetical protein
MESLLLALEEVHGRRLRSGQGIKELARLEMNLAGVNLGIANRLVIFVTLDDIICTWSPLELRTMRVRPVNSEQVVLEIHKVSLDMRNSSPANNTVLGAALVAMLVTHRVKHIGQI